MGDLNLICRAMKKVMVPAIIWPTSCIAAHPLVTDDTGTQGKSGVQMELNADRARSKSGVSFSRNRLATPREINGTVTRTTLTNLTVTYGWTTTIDVSLNLPYQDTSATNSVKVQGTGDTGFDLKWRFYEKDGFSMAFKPQVLLPTGNEQRELGNGRASYGANALAAFEEGSLMLTANCGYTYNNNVVGARKDLWNLSTAVVWKIKPVVQLALDIGIYRNPDRSSDQDPAFVIAGLIYSPNNRLDLDIGIRKRLNKAEADHSTGAGITIRW